jgi:hypothetical protein
MRNTLAHLTHDCLLAHCAHWLQRQVNGAMLSCERTHDLTDKLRDYHLCVVHGEESDKILSEDLNKQTSDVSGLLCVLRS